MASTDSTVVSDVNTATTTPSGIVPSPSRLGSITPDALNTQDNLKIVTPPVDTTNHSGIINGVADSVANTYGTLNKQYQDLIAKQGTGGTDITNAMDVLKNKTADTQLANESSGVNKAIGDVTNATQTLSDLNAQALALKNEASIIPLNNENKAIGTGMTDTGIAPLNASDLRVNAIKALTIGQLADVASANLTGSNARLQMARDKAQQIIDLKYAPLEADLKTRQEQYNLNKDQLSTIDKARTEALGTKLKLEETQLADKKANDKAMSDTVLKASQGGAPHDLLATVTDGINKGTLTQNDVNTMLGQYTATVPASAQEYQYAVNHGYKGSYSQYQTEDANRKANANKVPTTVTERQTASLAKFSNAFVAGAKLKDGTPIIDNSGYVNPMAWKQAIQDAPRENINRATFIKEFGHLLSVDDNGVPSPAYGLTPADIKLITTKV